MNDEPSRNYLFAESLGATQGRPGGMRVAVGVSAAWATSLAGQVMLAASTNVLARLFRYCPQLDVLAPPVPARKGLPLVEPGRLLGEAVGASLSALAPVGFKGEYGTVARRDGYDVALSIGGAEVEAGRVIHLASDRWRAYAGLEPAVGAPDDPNPLGPLLAAGWGAALVAAELFRPLVPRPDALPGPPDGAWLSAFDYSDGRDQNPSLPGLDLGEVPILGLGAIGAAVAYALALLPRPRGCLHLIDPDVLSDSNVERHFVSARADVHRLKVEQVGSVLNTLAPTLKVHASAVRFEDWPRRDDPFEIALCGSDSGASRRALQFALPRELINGGTSGSGFMVSKHRFEEGPCAACLYPEPAEPTSDLSDVVRQFGVGEDVALELLSGRRVFDEEVAEAMHTRGRAVLAEERTAQLIGKPFAEARRVACSEAIVRPDLPTPTVGFVSFLPGVLMVAELVKARHFANAPLRAPSNVLVADAFDLIRLDREPRRKSRSCRCGDPLFVKAFRGRWGMG